MIEMLKDMSKEEIMQLIQELRNTGYDIRENTKTGIIHEEAEKLGLEDPYIASRISKPIYELADWATGNFTEKQIKGGSRTYANKNVSVEIEQEYRRICSEILNAIKKYYGRPAFRQYGYASEKTED